MSTSTLALPQTNNWIISRNQDLTFFICSALIGYALLAISVVNGGLPGRFLVAFLFAVDGPHVFSTLTRAIIDGSERRRLRLLWMIGFPICVFTVWILVLTLGGDGSFIVIATLSHYHISKQHMGFVMIYKRKARETSDFRIDKYFTLSSLILPFLFYLSAVLTDSTSLLLIFLLPALLLACLYVNHQMQKERVNKPKLLLLAGFIPLQWLAWSYMAADPHSIGRLVAVGVVVNVGHSVQYLRLMYFHNSNRYAERAGLLGLISSKWIYFVAAAVILALPGFAGTQLGLVYVRIVAVGFLFFHFVLDSRIWRIRGDAELARALQL